MKTLGDVFDDQCRRTPDVPAIVSRTTRLTFAVLHRWPAKLSLTLAPHVGPGQRVALLHDGGADVIERRATRARALASDDSPPLLQLAAHASGHRAHVVRSHARVVAELKALRAALGVETGDRILGCSGLVSTLLSALCAGATLYPGKTLPPREVFGVLAREHIT